MITATVRLTATQESRDKILQALRSLIEPIRVETGCVSCAVYFDLQDPNSIVLVEDWRTRGDLERHLGTAQYKKILEVMELSSEEPVVRFNSVVETKGLRLVAKVRGVDPE